MTVLDKLLKFGLRCPCGGEVLVMTEPGDPGMLYCSRCYAAHPPEFESMLDAMVAWLVLTGGPIPGEVPPPLWKAVIDRDTGHRWWYGQDDEFSHDGWDFAEDMEVYARDAAIPVGWYFVKRDLDTIRAWLTSKIEEATE